MPTAAARRQPSGSALHAFAAWRAQRPFWGAVVATAGAVELYSVTRAPMSVVVMQGLPGLATLFIAALTIILAVLTLAQPHLRAVTGWVILVMGILSILVSNLGGFVVGMIVMITGGALMVSWLPAAEPVGDTPAGGPPAPRPGRPRPAGQRPGKRPPPPRRTGAEGLLDAMLGRQPARRPVKRMRPPGGAGEGPTGPTGPPDRLVPPARPTDVRGRTWIVVPLLALSLAATGAVAAPAGAAGGAQRGDSIWDLLFPPPPTTPPPTPPPTTPAPTPQPGAAPAPAPSASATPTDPAPAPSDCSRSAYPRSMPAMGSTGALEAAAAVRDCAAVAAEAPAKVASAADGVPLVSPEVSTLKATSLTMNGLSYDGVTTLRSTAGPVQVLAFSLDTLDVAGMDQTYPFDGHTVSIKNVTGDAHITGNVRLYVTRMTGSVFGLVELTFTPESPPPLIVPFLVMTGTTSEVALVQADQVRASSLVSTVG